MGGYNLGERAMRYTVSMVREARTGKWGIWRKKRGLHKRSSSPFEKIIGRIETFGNSLRRSLKWLVFVSV